MAKKFKLKIYEKDNDDLYVVIINPWKRGHELPWSQNAINWIGAWLRLAAHKADETGVVRSIMTMSSRSEVVAQLSQKVDRNHILGSYRWTDFMDEEGLQALRRRKVDISGTTTQVFEYKWDTNGDPSERQWTVWLPNQSSIPPNSFLKPKFPRPSWTAVPNCGHTIASIILPLPKQGQEHEPGGLPVTTTTMDKAPANESLSSANACEPSYTPYERPTQLQHNNNAPDSESPEEEEEKKPIVKSEGADEAYNTVDDFLNSIEPEERKPKIEEVKHELLEDRGPSITLSRIVTELAERERLLLEREDASTDNSTSTLQCSSAPMRTAPSSFKRDLPDSDSVEEGKDSEDKVLPIPKRVKTEVI